QIIDFKTNEVSEREEIDESVEHYRPQLELYRRVLSNLLKLAEDRIELKLLYTLPGVARTL
ncbi:MAG: hypothetical protein AAF492_29740, partial [Verrucomicrobiota bacterium]